MRVTSEQVNIMRDPFDVLDKFGAGRTALYSPRRKSNAACWSRVHNHSSSQEFGSLSCSPICTTNHIKSFYPNTSLTCPKSPCCYFNMTTFISDLAAFRRQQQMAKSGAGMLRSFCFGTSVAVSVLQDDQCWPASRTRQSGGA